MLSFLYFKLISTWIFATPTTKLAFANNPQEEPNYHVESGQPISSLASLSYPYRFERAYACARVCVARLQRPSFPFPRHVSAHARIYVRTYT